MSKRTRRCSSVYYYFYNCHCNMKKTSEFWNWDILVITFVCFLFQLSIFCIHRDHWYMVCGLHWSSPNYFVRKRVNSGQLRQQFESVGFMWTVASSWNAESCMARPRSQYHSLVFDFVSLTPVDCVIVEDYRLSRLNIQIFSFRPRERREY